jgi:hypothetical protein
VATERSGSIILAGVGLGRYPHVCAFFEDRDEEYACFLPFIQDGIEAGEKAFHIVDPALRDDHLERLRQGGIDVEETQRTGQLEVKGWDESYLRGGGFDRTATLALIKEILNRGRAEGFPRSRLIARAEWALEAQDPADIVAYEALLNGQLQGYDDPVVCTYDTTRFTGPIVVDVLRTHPVAIIGGVGRENPFFAPPAEFMVEMLSRQQKRRKR